MVINNFKKFKAVQKWEEISENDFRFINRKLDYIPKKEAINLIEKTSSVFCPKIVIMLKSEQDDIDYLIIKFKTFEKDLDKIKNTKLNIFSIMLESKRATIYKDIDDWYWIEGIIGLFRCDEFNGLIDLLGFKKLF